MARRASIPISVAVEGSVDEVVLSSVARQVGAHVARVYGKRGKDDLRKKIIGFNEDARFNPWVVLVDLDDAGCAPELRSEWLPNPNRRMRLRFAVREIESWLLADPQSLARFLRVPISQIPLNPENLPDPKMTVVDLARRSRSRVIRDDMVPSQGSGRSIGPAYPSRLIEFTLRHWRPRVAMRNADSLRRCRIRIADLVAQLRQVA